MPPKAVIPGITEARELGDKENENDEEVHIKDDEIKDTQISNTENSSIDKITTPDSVKNSKQDEISNSKNNNNTTNIEDKEADLKNLSFQGIPNSILNKNKNKNLHKRSRSVLTTKHDRPISPLSSEENQGKDHPTHRNRSLDEISARELPHTAPKSRRTSYLSSSDQKIFNGWRKEFNTAFKKISVVSKLKTMRGSKSGGVQQHALSTDLIVDDEDIHTQKIASDLIASLLAGSPASLFASTQFLRDEHGNRRAPLLLTMLDVRVKPIENISSYLNGEQYSHFLDNDRSVNNINISLSRRSSLLSFSSLLIQGAGQLDGQNNNRYATRTSSRSNRQPTYTEINSHDHKNQMFELSFEYGVGENRYKWSVVKSYKNMLQLHHNLKIVSFQQNTVKKLYIDHNRFHKFQLPYFPSLKDKISYEKKEKYSNPLTRSESMSSNTSTNRSVNTVHSPISANFNLEQVKVKHLQDLIDEPDNIDQPMYLRLERYFRLLNLALCLRPHANRLFQFYEFSPMGNLLSYENGYQGKEGFLLIRSTAKTQGWRVSHFNAHDFKDMIERHTPKWFLVRDSYITYTSDICSTTPLDVFMVDSKFKIKCSGKIKNRNISKNSNKKSSDSEDEILSEDELDWDLENSKKISTNLLITLQNTERKLQIICKSEAALKLWVSSFALMAKNTVWSGKNRFYSFAPVRKNAFAKFLVDGRDYFWALSEALEMAKDVIYIHDWWLSPELYLRRPVNAHQEYRLDRMLRKCAERGVKIFIVVYRNVGATVGTDSLWTKHSMLGLHPNIHLIRSPNQWLQNTYFWAHHEKLCVIDSTTAFMGGIDLCFGRYDTPEHVLRDDYEDIKDQTFPGKDYSNARVCDFYELDKPFESMYDRDEVPRMPWHDVHMMTVGEPARDMARHFVQRWNYLLREKRPSRPTPLLLPPSDFTQDELENLPYFESIKTRSTCEMQILRSAGYWSLGLKETEKSIQNAYLKLIETSNHYIYIENQFFVTTSEWDGVVIENKIGDAIVDRIIRANSECSDWKAFIIIPLMPGFDSPIDQPEASSLRVIMQCQYQSISRGETSIFSRLKKLNIDPMQYIRFFSLRKWSTVGPYEKLVTEQLYVHAKILIVDDRSCIIGSANINERSQLGNRDSEIAVVIRDTDLVKTKMNDKEYYAGRFALELRQRLMREHLGCDVDLVEIVERKFGRLEKIAQANYRKLNTVNEDYTPKVKKSKLILSAMIELAYREVFDSKYSNQWYEKYCNSEFSKDSNYGVSITDHQEIKERDRKTKSGNVSSVLESLETTTRKQPLPRISTKMNSPTHSFNYRAGIDNLGIRDNKPISADPRLISNEKHSQEVNGMGPDGWKKISKKFKESVTEQLMEWSLKSMSLKVDGRSAITHKSDFLPLEEDIEEYISSRDIASDKKWGMLKRICYLQYLSHKIITKEYTNPKFNQKSKTANKFNGNLPDELHEGHSSLLEEQELDDDTLDVLLNQLVPTLSRPGINKDNAAKFLKLKFIDPYSFDDPLTVSFSEETFFLIAMQNTLLYRLVFHCQPDNAVQTWRDFKDFKRMSEDFIESQNELINLERKDIPSGGNSNSGTLDGSDYDSNGKLKSEGVDNSTSFENSNGDNKLNNVKKKTLSLQMKLGGSILYGFNKRIFDKYTARRILERIHGNLVLFPTEWLAREVESKNWFYSADRLPPIDIYD